MKLALAQMRMTKSMETNLETSLRAYRQAKGCDLLLFPEIQLTPFFPQYPARDVPDALLTAEGREVRALCAASAECGLWSSPNLYLSLGGRPYDSSLMIRPDGTVAGISKMVHVAQAERFYEQDYYTPSDEGFRVFKTPFGRIGIVICFDRHLPESIRSCALQGADLVLIPTANTKAEPMELFEWEVRVQAFQNGVFIAMANRTGTEGGMVFSGESLVAGPDGERIAKAGGGEELVTAEVDLPQAAAVRARRPYLALRRPEMY